MSCWLGIDCGTGKVAVSVIDTARRQLHHAGRVHGADLPSAWAGHHEQDAEKILATVDRLLAELPPDLRAACGGVGLTGQMHGVLLHDDRLRPLTPLVTWQDQRCRDMNLPDGVHSGYGMATLAWWRRNGGVPAGSAATIHGLVAARLCGHRRAVIDPSDRHAWGWGRMDHPLPAERLPRAVDSGAWIGKTTAGGCLPAGLTVVAPMGDNQASVRAVLDDPSSQIALTIGTGIQASVVVPSATGPDIPGLERRPYDQAHDLLVAAGLAGGSAWRWLAETARGWVAALGGEPPAIEAVYERLDGLATASGDKGVHFVPHLGGERGDPGRRAAWTGLDYRNADLGQLARALAYGLIDDLVQKLGPDLLAGRRTVVGTGNALRRNRILQQAVRDRFACALRLSTAPEEAATGAALFARDAGGRRP